MQPGIVLDALRDAAEKHDLTFAPDPATHSRCTLGGMIGNNSCGVHALMGGKTVDNIEALDILLYDGTRMTRRRDHAKTSSPRSSQAAAGAARSTPASSACATPTQRSSASAFRDIPRRVSGYNLDQLLPENGFNVARALVGTEGTCVTILEANCELKPSPQHRRLVALGFADAFIAADHVPAVLAFNPIGLEGFDGLLVDFMLRKNLLVDDVKLLPAGAASCSCEFGADSPEDGGRAWRTRSCWRRIEQFADVPTERSTRRRRGRARLEGPRVRPRRLASSCPASRAAGKAGKTPPSRPSLGAYLRELFQLIDEYGYRTPMYGHFGQGCVHLRITFDFKTTEGVAKYRSFIERGRRHRAASTAARSPASTATARPAPRCCRRCSGRN